MTDFSELGSGFLVGFVLALIISAFLWHDVGYHRGKSEVYEKIMNCTSEMMPKLPMKGVRP